MTDRLPVSPAAAPRGPALSRQRGVTFVGMVLVAALVGVVGVLAARIVPSALEYQSVVKAAERAAAEARTPGEARAIFDRAAAVDDISSIKGSDLEIGRGAGEKPLVRFAYQREFRIAGPVYLTLKYSGQAGTPDPGSGAKPSP